MWDEYLHFIIVVTISQVYTYFKAYSVNFNVQIILSQS